MGHFFKKFSVVILLPTFLLVACGLNSECSSDFSMSQKTYTGCDIHMIPVDNWAVLSDDGASWGHYYNKGGSIFWKGQIDQKLENVDAASFSVNGKYMDFATDKNGFYYFGEPLKVDIKTFEILGEAHSKDKNGVYYQWMKIEGADPATFEVIDDKGNSKDKNGYYLYEKSILPPV